MLLPQLSFLLLNVVFFVIILLVTIERVCGCDEMHHLFAPINTLCVCHFGVIQCGHHFALVFWRGACCSPPHCASNTHDIWTVDVVEWHSRGFTQRSNPSIAIIRVPSNTSHHMAHWVSNADVTLATHHIKITTTCFPPPTLHQW